MGKNKDKIKLVIIDFDKTMTSFHTHNAAIRSSIHPFTTKNGLILNNEACQGTKKSKNYSEKDLETWARSYFSSEERFAYKNEQVQFFRELWENEVEIVIASHNKFPKIIEIALVVMGFTADEINKITIICGSPLNNFAGKNEHIELAIAKYSIESDNIVFIDDSGSNINRACPIIKKLIHVYKPGVYMEEARKFLVHNYSEEQATDSVHYSSGDDEFSLSAVCDIESQDENPDFFECAKLSGCNDVC